MPGESRHDARFSAMAYPWLFRTWARGSRIRTPGRASARAVAEGALEGLEVTRRRLDRVSADRFELVAITIVDRRQPESMAHSAETIGEAPGLAVAGDPRTGDDPVEQAQDTVGRGFVVGVAGSVAIEQRAEVSRIDHATGPPELAEERIETLARDQGAVEGDLDEGMRQETHLPRADAGRVDAGGGLRDGRPERRLVVEPPVGVEVVRDARGELTERDRVPVPRVDAVAGTRAAIRHAPDIGQHGADPGHVGVEIVSGEVPVEKEVQSIVALKNSGFKNSLLVPYQKARKFGSKA